MDRGDTHSVKAGIEILSWRFTRVVIILFSMLNIWFILITLHDIIIFFNTLVEMRMPRNITETFCFEFFRHLLTKIEELRKISKDTNSAVIRLSETKLDKTILDSEISIPNCSLIRRDRNRKGEGVACYIRSNIFFNSQNYLSDKVENISFDLLLPKTKSISIAIAYKSPTENHFLDYLSRGLNDF